LLWLAAGGAILLLTAIFWWFANQAERGITFAAPDRPIPWTDVPQGGVNLPSLHFEQPDVISRTLDTARAAGFHWIRVQFPWEDIEIHAKDDFRDYRHDYNGDGATNEADAISAWAKYDQIVAAAQARDLELIVRLDRPPAWARQNLPQEDFRVAERANDPGETGPPDRYADYGDYVAAVVGRYRGKVRFFQLWNEPNLGHEWNWADPDPAQFVELLKIGAERARAANPEVVILFPSLSPADGLDWRAMSDLEYLEQVYELGAAPYFDIFTAQQYGLGQPPSENRYIRPVYNASGQVRRDLLWSRPLDSRTDITRVVLLREIMERHGDSGKAVWISEFGWNSNPGPHSFGIPVSEEQKAAYLVDLMRRARREWPWMGVMNVWFLRAGAGFDSAKDPTVDFQLVREDWTPLPAYAAVQSYLTAPAVVGPGRYPPGHPAFQRAGATISLRFWGDSVAVEGAGGEQVAIDGQPLAGGRAEGLALAEHSLTISGGSPRSIAVGREPSGHAFWLIAPFGLLILMIIATERFLATFR
jgi:hypothetical protein